MRLAVLVTHPIQYFAPMFRALAQKYRLELKVFFGCNHGTVPQVDPNFGVAFKWDCNPTDGYDYEFIWLGSFSALIGISGVQLARRAVKRINCFKPDAVLIFAYTPAFISASTVLLGLGGYRLMLRAETTDEALDRSWIKDKLRQVILSNYYRQFWHVFPIGTNSKNHYRRMGVVDNEMTLVEYAIDVDFFQRQVDYWLPQRQALRAAMGIEPTAQVLMYCGKMFEPKNPLLIVEALALLSPDLKERLWLLAVGDGVLRSEFEAGAKGQLGDRAVFVGFKNQSELGQYYALADTLVLPSQSGETWGLVVNEALQFGLRVVVSDKVGSSRDLILDEAQGYRFSSGSAEELSTAITAIVQRAPEDKPVLLPHPDNLAEAVYSQL